MTSPPFWQLRSYTDGGQHYDGQIGDEPTPREYIDSLIACTREWMRVLKPAGSLFVELGDKYSDRGHGPNRGNGTGRGPQGTQLQQTRGPLEKSLLDLPHRYAIRCMDELGLILRAEIIWHHVNGLPESVTDRVRRAHSVVFHFTVQPRYFAAVDEIREPHHRSPGVAPPGRGARIRADRPAEVQPGFARGPGGEETFNPLGKLPGSVWSIPSAPLSVPGWLGVDHFAAYPPELCRRIILGWSPPGICTACGEGRRPVIRIEHERGWVRATAGGRHRSGDGNPGERIGQVVNNRQLATITGYACACPQPDAPTRPALVVDPFAGTGTSMLTASVLGRIGIGIDRSGDYCRLAKWRCADPGERARALGVPKPPPVPDGQASLFDGEAV